MDNFKDLELSFTVRKNHYYDSMFNHTAHWVLSMGMITTEAGMVNFLANQTSLFAAYAYPVGDLESSKLYSDWCAWLFLVGEVINQSGDPSEYGDRISIIVDEYNQAFKEPRSIVPSSPIQYAFQDLWIRMQASTTRQWQQNLVSTIKQLFTKASVTVSVYHKTAIIPDLDYYIPFRRIVGAAYPCYIVMEIGREWNLPAEVYQHPLIKQYLEYANDLICWCNDVYSLECNLATHEIDNLVTALELQANCTILEATAVATRLIYHRSEEIRELRHNLPSFSHPDVDRSVHEFIASIDAFVAGTLQFSKVSGRYKTGKEFDKIVQSIVIPSDVCVRLERKDWAGLWYALTMGAASIYYLCIFYWLTQ